MAATDPATIASPPAEATGPGGRGSRYLEYLPAHYRQDAPLDGSNWLGRFLLAFEEILTGAGDPGSPGLEETLDGVGDGSLLRGIERTFEPGPGLKPGERAPDEFLGWLSGWVALSLRADVDQERRRLLIANAVRLYRLRGTKRGLEELIGLYTTLAATVDEATPAFQIGVHSRLGVDTWIDGGPPHCFHVTIRLPTTRPDEMADRRRVVESIIDAEKPAHTDYTVHVETPALQIGVTSRIGVDTLLGGAS